MIGTHIYNNTNNCNASWVFNYILWVDEKIQLYSYFIVQDYFIRMIWTMECALL